MQIKGVGVSTAGMMTGVSGIQVNGGFSELEEDMFGPEYEVTISEEGRNLSRQQTAQKEMGVIGAQNSGETRALLRQLEEDQLAEKKRQGYYDELEELEKQIKVMNAAYGRMRSDLSYNDPLMKELVEKQQLLEEKMQEHKDFQEEESLRRLKEAQRMAAMQASQYQEEIDENNRDLVTMLKTMEEADKAEDAQGNGVPENDGDGASDTEYSAGDTIHNSAQWLMKSSLNHEKGVEELSGKVEDLGHWFLSQANETAQNLLKTSTSIKKAIADESFTNGQIDEMMESFRREVKAKSEEAYIDGSFGTQILRDMRDVKLQRIADNPLQAMQQTKNGMVQAAADAVIGEARNSSLDKASDKLAEEVEELIDERNHVDRIPQDEEAEKTQDSMPEEEKEE